MCCVRYKLRLKKQFSIDYVLCEVGHEAEETVERPPVLCEVKLRMKNQLVMII